MLSTALEKAVDRAYHSAQSANHEFLTLEHLLLALLDERSVVDALLTFGVDLAKLREQLNKYLNEHCPQFPQDNSGRVTQPTTAFQRMIQRAVLHARNAGKQEVSCLNALVAIISERDSYAAYFLRQQEVERLDLVNYITHGGAQPAKESEEAKEGEENEGPRKSAISEFTNNLNQRAQEGRIDPLIGRSREIERTIQTLCRRRKNNPILVGEAGVGKTAIAEGLAKAIVEGDVPPILKNATIYSLDIGSLLAGTKYRGRLRKPYQSPAQRTARHPRRHPLYRRNPHHHRRGLGKQQQHGCLQPHQTGTGERRTALHRRHHRQRIPANF